MLVVNSELVQSSQGNISRAFKFIFNDSAIIFFPAAQQHNSMKAHGLSYDDDYRGNALAGILGAERIEVRFHQDFSDERVRVIWTQVCESGELSFLKARPLYYQGRKIDC